MYNRIVKLLPNVLNYIKLFGCVALIFVLSSCIKNPELVGYTFKTEKLDQVKAGQTSKDYVKNTLGTPSTISTYGKETWYYISTEYEDVAFFKPKMKDHKVIAITFDETGMVSLVKEYNKNDARNIKISSDRNMLGEDDGSIIEQLLGNVGRFNSDPSKPKKVGAPRSGQR